MPRGSTGSKGASAVKIKVGGAKASPAQKSELDELREQLASLTAQLNARPTGGAEVSRTGRVYAPAQTPRAVALEIAQENPPAMMRDIMDLMVKRVPGSPTSKNKPYGEAVTVVSKSGARINAMKDGVDRGDYIKLRNLIQQISGDYSNHRDPEPLTDEQIDKILRPVLDNCATYGFFSWE